MHTLPMVSSENSICIKICTSAIARTHHGRFLHLNTDTKTSFSCTAWQQVQGGTGNSAHSVRPWNDVATTVRNPRRPIGFQEFQPHKQLSHTVCKDGQNGLPAYLEVKVGRPLVRFVLGMQRLELMNQRVERCTSCCAEIRIVDKHPGTIKQASQPRDLGRTWRFSMDRSHDTERSHARAVDMTLTIWNALAALPIFSHTNGTTASRKRFH
jgi:hypothetical protein